MLRKIIVASIASMLMCSASFAEHVSADVSASAITGVTFEKGTEGGTASLDQVNIDLKSDINEFSELNVKSTIMGGSGTLTLKEAYVTFEDFIANTTPLPGYVPLNAKVGRQYVEFGNANNHKISNTFVSRSLASRYFLGSYMSPLKGDGLGAIVELPSLDGLGQLSFTALNGGTSDGKIGVAGLNGSKFLSIAYENSVANFDFGLDFVSDFDSDTATSLLGFNASTEVVTPMGNPLDLSANLFNADYNDDTQTGASVSAVYGLNDMVSVGARYSMVSEWGNSDNDNSQVSLLLTRNIGDNAQTKFEYSTYDSDLSGGNDDYDVFEASVYVGLH